MSLTPVIRFGLHVLVCVIDVHRMLSPMVQLARVWSVVLRLVAIDHLLPSVRSHLVYAPVW